jgi:hypothetical protein
MGWRKNPTKEEKVTDREKLLNEAFELALKNDMDYFG